MQQSQSGTITKEHVNRRGCNKFLEIPDNVRVTVNHRKIREDEKRDGMKGCLTGTALNAKDAYEQYSGLWVIEQAYRVIKGTLEMRPVFHFTHRRIEAHVCICFVAYRVYRELERILKLSGISLSVDRGIEHCQNNNYTQNQATCKWKDNDKDHDTDRKVQGDRASVRQKIPGKFSG